MKVLVGYASRHGATQGIAQRVADTLRRDGLEVTLHPSSRSTPVAAADAFGSAPRYYGLDERGRPVRAGDHLLLAAHPTWLFSSGPVSWTSSAKGRNVLETAEPVEFAEFLKLIGPLADRVFFGAYDPDNPPADLAERVVRLMPPIKKLLPTGDFRDWAEIEAWAEGIARDLGTAKAAATKSPVPA